MMIDLQPIGWLRRDEGVIAAKLNDGVIDGPEVDGDHERGKADGSGDLDETGFGVTVGRSGVVIEEALAKMTDEQRELAALRGVGNPEGGLRVEREGLRGGQGEKALEVVRHNFSA